jgi:hypothetical protein
LKPLRDNGLSITLIALFLLFWGGQAVTGYFHHNEEARSHGRAPVSFGKYLTSSDFFEATFENWESEFLQMAAYVILTVCLFQRGSAESKDPDKAEEPDPVTEQSPAPVRRGGWQRRLYNHSLSLALVTLFFLSWIGHAFSGHSAYNEDQLQHGLPTISLAQFMLGSQFWFQSFQNWQSEFLAVFSIVVLSIWLRQKGSPESKPTGAAHVKTGK